MRYIKYYLIVWSARTPLVLGVLALIFIWFIREPYYSDMIYLTGRVVCCECGGKYAGFDKMCRSCGCSFEKSASVKELAHCNYCNDGKVYRSGSGICKDCGRKLQADRLVSLSDLGFLGMSKYRNAKMYDNLMIVLNHRISLSIMVCTVAVTVYARIKKFMRYLVMRKFMKERASGR
ncbi:MAG: hypothetical protein NC393_04145 [Clostridium sp.]|nr:hypothetical protein [Clostridium sp.]MCM1208960.1 hypothetical protein [Ruminococcus sp.]